MLLGSVLPCPAYLRLLRLSELMGCLNGELEVTYVCLNLIPRSQRGNRELGWVDGTRGHGKIQAIVPLVGLGTICRCRLCKGSDFCVADGL
jgi:hypothetical protein